MQKEKKTEGSESVGNTEQLECIGKHCSKWMTEHTSCDECPIHDICSRIGWQYEDFPKETEEAYNILRNNEKDDYIQDYCLAHDPQEFDNCKTCKIEGFCNAVCGQFAQNPQVLDAAYNTLVHGGAKSSKINKVEMHRQICDELNAIYARKNADYGDSFHISYEEEGMAMPRIRIGDKYNRFKTLTKSNDIKVKDESIRDTLLDLANYAIMTAMELGNE